MLSSRFEENRAQRGAAASHALPVDALSRSLGSALAERSDEPAFVVPKRSSEGDRAVFILREVVISINRGKLHSIGEIKIGAC